MSEMQREVDEYNRTEFPLTDVIEYGTDPSRNKQAVQEQEQATGNNPPSNVSPSQESKGSTESATPNGNTQGDTLRPSQNTNTGGEKPATPAGESRQDPVKVAPRPLSETESKIEEIRQKKSELAQKLAQKLREKRGQLNSGIDPEILSLGIEYVGLQTQLGLYKLSQVIEDFIAEVGMSDPDTIKALKGAYSAYRDGYASDEEYERMDSSSTVRNYQPQLIQNSNEQTEETTTDGSLRGNVGGILPTGQSEPISTNAGTENLGSVDNAQDRQASGLPVDSGNAPRNEPGPSGGTTLAGVHDAARRPESTASATDTQPSTVAATTATAAATDNTATTESKSVVADPPQRTLPDPKEGEPVLQVKPNNNFVLPPDQQDPATFSTAKKFDDNIAALEVLLLLQNENRLVTPQEQTQLAKYIGFGGLAQVLKYSERYNHYTGDSAHETRVRRVYALIQQLYPNNANEAWDSIRSSTLSAYYTPFQAVRGIYNAIRNSGFSGGRILEPSMGTGNFFGVMPSEWGSNSALHGVELDLITGRIAQNLYPDANIQIKPFEQAKTPTNYFDLVISNIPFGNFSVSDPTWANRKEGIFKTASRRIHDYFAVKMIESARPGGIVVIVTSKGILDKKDTAVRKYISDNTEFLGALRLPDTTFKGNANTSVVTDVIFLKKKDSNSPMNQIHNFMGLTTVWVEEGKDSARKPLKKQKPR